MELRDAIEVVKRKWVFRNNEMSCALQALVDYAEQRDVSIEVPGGGYLKGRVLQEGRRENIPGVAEGSMAELFLLSVDPDDEMGGW